MTSRVRQIFLKAHVLNIPSQNIAYQYAIVEGKVYRGLKYVSIKSTQVDL